MNIGKSAIVAIATMSLIWNAQAFGADIQSGQTRIVVSFAPGGGTDLVARSIAAKMQGPLGQPVIVENKPGAAGQIAIDAVLKAEPDGKTILMATPGFTILPSIQKVRYDPRTDFVPVSLTARVVHALVVRKDLPVNSVRELVAYAKANPGRLSYASVGIGTSNHLEMELLNTKTGVSMTHVPYNSTPAGLNDLLAGRIDLLFNDMSTLRGPISSGAIRPLAVSSGVRSTLAPNIPTMIEAGVPGYDVAAWIGLFAPAGTKPGVVEDVSEGVAVAVKDPVVANQLNSLGMEGLAWGPKRFGEFINAEIERWAQVVKAANIRAE